MSIKNLLNEKSRDRNARLSNAQTSSPYNRTGQHLKILCVPVRGIGLKGEIKYEIVF